MLNVKDNISPMYPDLDTLIQAYGKNPSLNLQKVFLQTTGNSKPLASYGEHEKGVSSPCLLPDGRLASVSIDKTIKIWNLKIQQCEVTLKGHENWICSLCVLSDGRWRVEVELGIRPSKSGILKPNNVRRH